MPGLLWLTLEFLLLYIGVPILFATRAIPLPIIPSMLFIALICTLYLIYTRDYDIRARWSTHRLRFHLRPVFTTFFCFAPLMVVMLWSLEPDYLFNLPRNRPDIWLMVMFFYPLVSVVPQSIIWRGLLLHRYRPLIGTGWPAVLIAAAAFSFAHLYFMNVIALLLTFVGGLLFVMRYKRSGSLLVATIEHAMYGCWAFTVGYGRFLYAGASV